MKILYRLAAAVALAGGLAACGGDDGGPSGPGRIQAVVVDPLTASFSGSVGGNVQVSISEDSTTWVDLGSLNGITIQLQTDGDTINVHGEQGVPAVSYSWVRLTFDGAQANLDAGSVVGTMTLSNDVSVDLGGSDDRAEVVKPLSFTASESTTTRTSLVFRLNSEDWLTEAAVSAQVVEDAALENMTVIARSEPTS